MSMSSKKLDQYTTQDVSKELERTVDAFFENNVTGSDMNSQLRFDRCWQVFLNIAGLCRMRDVDVHNLERLQTFFLKNRFYEHRLLVTKFLLMKSPHRAEGCLFYGKVFLRSGEASYHDEPLFGIALDYLEPTHLAFEQSIHRAQTSEHRYALELKRLDGCLTEARCFYELHMIQMFAKTLRTFESHRRKIKDFSAKLNDIDTEYRRL